MKDISIIQTLRDDSIKLRISKRTDDYWTPIKAIIILNNGEVKVYDIKKGIKKTSGEDND